MPNSKNKLFRGHFLFSKSCNMKCPYCYVKFHNSTKNVKEVLPEWGTPPSLKRSIAVVERMCELGIQMITFSGGDPMIYPWIGELITFAAQLGILVHVDTNGIGLKPAQYDLLLDKAFMIGMPLDGPLEVHDQQRRYKGHFNIVYEHLKQLCPKQSPSFSIKINTTVTRVNYRALKDLANLIAPLSPKQWSLFEFAAIESGFVHKDEYQLDREMFLSAVSQIKHLPFASSFSNDDRNGIYFQTDHLGHLQIPNMLGTEVQVLGSIFDDAVIDAWFHQGQRSPCPNYIDRVFGDTGDP